MTPKKSHEHTLKNAISDFLNDQHLDNKLAELDIINNWEKLVGTMIAKNTTEIKFRGTILYLKIESNALRNELMYQRGKIMALVNTEANQQLITDVNIR
jgi:predicted nucleic acid-binding Zn ribbon protein